MGCTGSRAVKEFSEKNKEGFGKESELDSAVQLLEGHLKVVVTEIKKIQYTEKTNGTKVLDAQNWIIEATLKDKDEKITSGIYSIFTNAKGESEIVEGKFQ
jgi:hypothetical protein